MNNIWEQMLAFKSESLGNNLVRDIKQSDGPTITYVFGIAKFWYEFDITLINNVG